MLHNTCIEMNKINAMELVRKWFRQLSVNIVIEENNDESTDVDADDVKVALSLHSAQVSLCSITAAGNLMSRTRPSLLQWVA